MRNLFFPILIYLFVFVVFQCKTPDFENPCDLKSENFLYTMIIKYGIVDSSPHCGLSSFPGVSAAENLYAGRDNWLDYIKNDGTTPLLASNTPCDGSETGGFAACIHAGAMRSVQVKGGFFGASCDDGYTASDNESAFHYNCSEIDGGIRFTSVSLLPGKRLGDLVDGTTNPLQFKPLQISVFKNGKLIGQSDKKIWWKNRILSLPVSGGTIGSPYDLYYVGTNLSGVQAITFNSNQMGIIAVSGTQISYSGTGVFLTLNGNFQYLEGGYASASGTTHLIYIGGNSRFANVRELAVVNNGQLLQVSGSFGLYQNLTLGKSPNNGTGLGISDSSTPIMRANSFHNVVTGGTDGPGIYVYPQTSVSILNHIFSNVTVYAATDETIAVSSPSSGNDNSGHIFREITVANSGSNGGLYFYRNSGASLSNISVLNYVSVNQSADGLTVNSQITGDMGITFQNIAMLRNSNVPINQNNVNALYYTGNLKISSAAGCTIAGGVNPGILNGSCDKAGSSDFNLTTNASYDFSFVGSVSQNDSVNPFDNAGLYSSVVPTNDVQFFALMENRYRTWINSDSLTGFTDLMRGNCGVNCRIFDWSLKATDATLLNTNPCPDPANPLVHKVAGSSATDAGCHSIFLGAKTSAGNVCQVTHLRNAVEIVGDGVGNDNSLCESGEHCIYTPNIASYQGHGKLGKASAVSPNFCKDIGSGNVLANIKLFQYEQNGY
ncbi:hypothetical protein [Leptospira idonii]|uniref:Right-handed parallel beta-helix repeat-containing protein n=1 Tax=Leptospira idonii TaxID=1193500 RepID=A0A4V3JY84_9LEPT|nr:hypothetical protein [Leptospira idonii]TGN19756.1 hypothetical protein EHS15_08260 [Leptospira idonii]